MQIIIDLVNRKYCFWRIIGSFQGNISEDPINNKLYIEINDKGGVFTESNKMSYKIVNCLVYDMNTKEKIYIFPEDNKKNISSLLFEVNYDTTEKRMILNGEMNYSNYKMYGNRFVVNNYKLEYRLPKNKILFIISGSKTSDPDEIWTCGKSGNGLKMVKELQNNETWYIDFKHEKIIVVRQNKMETEIFEYDW